VLALLGGAVLLVLDSAPRGLLSLNHAPVSAAPLLLIGLAYVGVQPLMRPRPLELFKQLMLGGAFIL
jgi:hypothetical protein